MWRPEPSPEANHLSNYWNALNRNAPEAELARLAALVDPSLVAAIQRVRALHQVRRPDPAFAARLETTIMDRVAVPNSGPLLVPPFHPPTAGAHRGQPGSRSRNHRPVGRRLAVGFNVALAALLVIAALAGMWLVTDRHDGPRVLVPGDATPTVVASPEEVTGVPMYRGNPARTGVFPGPSLLGTPVELWKHQAGEPVNLGAAVVDGVIYLPAGNQGFEARNAFNGTLLWTFPTDAAAISAPAVVGGLGFVIDGDGTLYAVDVTDGTEVWRFANTNIRSSMLPLDGMVYAVSPEGTSFALDAATGEVIWQAELGAEAAGGMAYADGLVFQGNGAGVMTALDAATGEVRWTFQNDEGRNNATVTVANGQIYITVSGGDVNAFYAVDTATGELTWRQEQGAGLGFISTTATPTLLYSVAEDGLLHAINAATGETVWTYQLLEFVRSIPVLVDDTLYVADNGGFVRALNPTTGSQLWEYPIAGEVDFGWPVVSEGILYIGTSFGNFYAITGSGSLGALSDVTPIASASPEATPQTAASNLPTLIWETGEDIDLDDSNLGGIAIDADGVIHVPDLVRGVITMIGPDGEFIGEWGSPGDGPGEFDFNAQTFSSGSLAVDDDGNIYVVDGINNRIQKFDANRTFITEWGGIGSGNGEFRVPGAAFVSGDRIYVTDAMNHRVQVFDLDGTFVTAWGEFGAEPGQLNTPCAIAVMPDGTVYVAEEPTRRIQHFTADGEYLGELAQPDPGFGVVYSLAVDQAGNLWAASSLPRRIMAFTPDGSLIVEFNELPDAGFLDTPGSLAFDSDGNLVLTATNGEGWTYATRSDGRGRILKLAVPFTQPATASATIVWESSDDVALLGHAAGVTLAPDGTVWVADGANSRFQIFDQDGTLLYVWGEQGSGEGQFNFIRNNGDGLGGVVFAPDGSFYVADTGNARIQHFDVDGNLLNLWGSFGTEPGEFISPDALAIDTQGNLYVSDSMREDIQKFAPDGTHLATIGESGSAPGQLDYQGFIAIAPDDSLWVADPQNGRLHHFAADGTLIAALDFRDIPGEPVWIQSLTFDVAGRLYLADIDGGRLFVLDADGSVLGIWSLTRSDGTNHPNSGGMVVLADGGIILADWEGGTLYRYELDPPFEASPVATPAG